MRAVITFHLDTVILFRAKTAENGFPCQLQPRRDFPVTQLLS